MKQFNNQKVCEMPNDSMMPHIEPGAILHFRKQNRIEYIRYGEVYYTATLNSEYIGRLRKGSSPDTVLSVSSNPLFLDVEIPIGDIKELYIFYQMYTKIL